MKRHPLLRSFVLLTLVALAVSKGHAQDVDNGEFNRGDNAPADNSDSEFVPGVAISHPSYGGTGCQQGSVSTALSPDQKTLSVIFDNYMTEAGGGTGVQRNAVDCVLNIPFTVPPGYRVSVVKLDYRGFTMVPAGGRSTFGAGYRILEIDGRPVNAKRVLRAKVFVGPTEEDFELTSRVQGAPWSPCGRNFTLQAESRILVQTNGANDQVLTAIDSLDTVAEPVVYHLRWKKCGPPDSVGRPGGPPPMRPTPQPRRPARPNPPTPPGRGGQSPGRAGR